MKSKTFILFLAFLLSACDTWGVPPQPFPVWTPIPSRTPGIVTATPLILLLPTFPIVDTGTSTMDVPLITPSPIETETPSATFTLIPDQPSETVTPGQPKIVDVEILGCNSSPGDVTNAFVTLKNTGALDLPNTCAVLGASDEEGLHPDRKKCVDQLPAQYRVTLKLTVNSVYKPGSIIQVDVLADEFLLLRVEGFACMDIGLSGGEPADVGLLSPINP